MQLHEELMALFPELDFVYDPMMPKKQKGLLDDNIVYLNPNQTYLELPGTIGEELGHHLTTVGDITAQATRSDKRQERRARDIGAILVVSPYDIIECYEHGCKTVAESAEYLQITVETLKTAIAYYSRKFNGIKTENNYTLLFQPNGTVAVLKSFNNF
ncbi:toxin [Enterococcus sp.]|uniref:ImmA/IrrE family metallo-endopeptidase n=1 Tax=Enterococcus sp. TaxID=35783 RepID=UPI0028984750|nr:toxin [Enterococcus sp.]